MSNSEDERIKLAKEIVKQFFTYIDESLGRSIRKKIIYLAIGIILVAAISIGLIKIPGAGS